MDASGSYDLMELKEIHICQLTYYGNNISMAFEEECHEKYYKEQTCITTINHQFHIVKRVT